MKKKFECVLLVLSLVLNFGGYAFASAPNQNVSENTKIEILTTETFSALFTETKNNLFGMKEKCNDISYYYTFSQSEFDEMAAFVILNFDIDVGQKSYSVVVEGNVDGYELSDKRVLWEGPLRGNIRIGEKEYSVIAGFAKISNDDKIQVTVTIQAKQESEDIGPVVFSFGEKIVTTALNNEILAKERYNNCNTLDNGTKLYASGNFSYIAGISRNFDEQNMTGHAQTAKAYFERATNQYAVSFQSYCKNVDKFYASLGGLNETSIKSLSYSLKRNTSSASSYSYIVGIETFSFNPSNFGKGSVYLEALFEDAMGLLGVPTSTISAVLDGTKGSVSKEEYTNQTDVNFTFGLLDHANFDNSGNGVPIVFQLGRNVTGYTGGSTYTFETNVTYRTEYIPANSTQVLYLYTDAYPASAETTITLS